MTFPFIEASKSLIWLTNWEVRPPDQENDQLKEKARRNGSSRGPGMWRSHRFFGGVVFYADDATEFRSISFKFIICQCLGFVLARVPRYNISFLFFTFHRYRGTAMHPNHLDDIIEHLAFFQHIEYVSTAEKICARKSRTI